jgi:hypothetical protein
VFLLSSLSSAVLAHFILKERLQALGVLGCVMCITGSMVIVIHAPQEQEIASVKEIWKLATQPCETYGIILGVIFVHS